MRGMLSPLSGLICEIIIFNSVGQGNFTFVREKSGNFRNLWLLQPLLKHDHTTMESGACFPGKI